MEAQVRSPRTFDYSAPVTSWPDKIRTKWPNTIATLVLIERERIAGASLDGRWRF